MYSASDLGIGLAGHTSAIVTVPQGGWDLASNQATFEIKDTQTITAGRYVVSSIRGAPEDSSACRRIIRYHSLACVTQFGGIPCSRLALLQQTHISAGLQLAVTHCRQQLRLARLALLPSRR